MKRAVFAKNTAFRKELATAFKSALHKMEKSEQQQLSWFSTEEERSIAKSRKAA